jgi:hypothetical protein
VPGATGISPVLGRTVPKALGAGDVGIGEGCVVKVRILSGGIFQSRKCIGWLIVLTFQSGQGWTNSVLLVAVDNFQLEDL